MPPPRSSSRDFRISADDASRLAGRAGWRRILKPFATSRAAILGPVAATLMTLGLAGLLFSTGSGFLFGAGGSASDNAALGPTTASTMPEATGRETVGGFDVGAVRASTVPADESTGGTNPPRTGDAKHTTTDAGTPQAPDRTWLVAASGLLILAGGGAFALRRLARRER